MANGDATRASFMGVHVAPMATVLCTTAGPSIAISTRVLHERKNHSIAALKSLLPVTFWGDNRARGVCASCFQLSTSRTDWRGGTRDAPNFVGVAETFSRGRVSRETKRSDDAYLKRNEMQLSMLTSSLQHRTGTTGACALSADGVTHCVSVLIYHPRSALTLCRRYCHGISTHLSIYYFRTFPPVVINYLSSLSPWGNWRPCFKHRSTSLGLGIHVYSTVACGRIQINIHTCNGVYKGKGFKNDNRAVVWAEHR
ncbi:hypothetical protein EDB85DRAFT_2280230, partial [Lactarius pseudohatsudake]